MYIKTALEGKTERNRKRTSKNSSPSFNAVHVVYSSHGEGRLCRYSRQLKLNSEFYEKKEFEEISICSFTPIRSTELKKKIVLVLVRSVKFLSDATIPFQIKPWEYEDWMKNSDEKVNAMHKAVFRCEGLLTYVNNNRNASFNVIF